MKFDIKNLSLQNVAWLYEANLINAQQRTAQQRTFCLHQIWKMTECPSSTCSTEQSNKTLKNITGNPVNYLWYTNFWSTSHSALVERPTTTRPPSLQRLCGQKAVKLDPVILYDITSLLWKGQCKPAHLPCHTLTSSERCMGHTSIIKCRLYFCWVLSACYHLWLSLR